VALVVVVVVVDVVRALDVLVSRSTVIEYDYESLLNLLAVEEMLATLPTRRLLSSLIEFYNQLTTSDRYDSIPIVLRCVVVVPPSTSHSRILECYLD